MCSVQSNLQVGSQLKDGIIGGWSIALAEVRGKLRYLIIHEVFIYTNIMSIPHHILYIINGNVNITVILKWHTRIIFEASLPPFQTNQKKPCIRMKPLKRLDHLTMLSPRKYLEISVVIYFWMVKQTTHWMFYYMYNVTQLPRKAHL